jgi:hypothetical protein
LARNRKVREIALGEIRDRKGNAALFEGVVKGLCFARLRAGRKTMQVQIAHKTLILGDFRKDYDKPAAALANAHAAW